VHAAGAGELARAGRAHLELAEEERRRHAYVDAELEYSAALARLDGDEERMRALAGRASVRYQIHRLDDALADAAAARALAESLGDQRDTVELLLLEAMILDWKFDVDACEERTARARALVTGLTDLEPALVAAEGRNACRREDFTRGAELLARAGAEGDYQTRITSIVLLAGVLAFLGRTHESAVWFERVISLCEEVGDDFHLAIALSNRTALWSRLGHIDRATLDLRRAIEIARRFGNALVERTASYNLAEQLYWQGDLEGALPLALRTRELQQRFVGDDELPDSALLVARIQAARGQHDAARAELELVRGSDGLAPTARALIRMLDLVLAPSASADEWEDLERAVAALDSAEILLEVQRFAGKR
ncbi:MAG TPA: hypothetical protein VFU21_20270, partial [Kofleriaceae bacterium]|nr:hypothetical protein [Kofleriaceae bacterium]